MEPVSPPDIPAPEKKPEEVKSVKIRYSVFFDGTLNNRTNINSRLVSAKEEDLTEEEKKTAKVLKDEIMSPEELRRAQGVYKENIGVSSYENGYTNIVKLERHLKTDPYGDNKHCLATYIDGPGSNDEDDDDLPGFAFGISFPFWGDSGVKKKVKTGLKDVVSQICQKHTNKKEVIDELVLDVFGFSRGAAGARFFIHKSFIAGSSVKNQLTKKGYQVDKVTFKFVGLFDTVSSHGFSFSNDTAELKLNAVSQADHVVHLAAADEHRENFSLTDIVSAKGKKGIQVYFPGVHSDIGGSYRDNKPEGLEDGEKTLNIFFDLGWSCVENAKKEKERLIKSGWFKEDEIEEIYTSDFDDDYDDSISEANLYVGRDKVSNQYSRIPLQIMADLATKSSEIKFEGSLKSDEKVSGKLSTVESKLRSYLDEHKDCSGKKVFTSTPEHWQHDTEKWLNDLRHDYFHFSAHYSIGMAPRFNSDGVRFRQVFKG